jgi:dTDP-glucose 4,6-dehydratase
VSINHLLGQSNEAICQYCGTPINKAENEVHSKKAKGEAMKNILVTGGAGFIGSNFIQYIIVSKPEYNIINLDALTYAGNLENLSLIKDSPKYTFIKGNICDGRLLDEIFTKYDIDTVVNFAAETHVDRSIIEPNIFVNSNVI